jgi:hypothetical protein
LLLPLQWENLLHLDTIKARSKPLAPPKKPEAAPFFLPTVPGLSRNPVFAADGEDTQAEAAEGGEAGEAAAAAGCICHAVVQNLQNANYTWTKQFWLSHSTYLSRFTS